MKKKELDNLAKKLAKAELVLHSTTANEKILKQAKETIYKISYQLSSYEDMCYVDDKVQEILNEIFQSS